MFILYIILCWEEINGIIVLIDKNIFFLDEDIIIFKYCRFIDIFKYKYNFIEFYLMS